MLCNIYLPRPFVIVLDGQWEAGGWSHFRTCSWRSLAIGMLLDLLKHIDDGTPCVA